MTIIRPDQLFDQAERLCAQTNGQQVDLRRSISAAYYGLFSYSHNCRADHLAGVARRRDAEWSLAARTVAHTKLSHICQEILKTTPAARYKPYILQTNFTANMKAFCGAVIGLQEKRHEADYNHRASFKVAEVKTVIATGRAAHARFRAVSGDEKRMFISLLVFDPR